MNKTLKIEVSKGNWKETVVVRDQDASQFIRTVFNMGGKAVIVKEKK